MPNDLTTVSETSSDVHPLLSICVPTYNRAKWLRWTLPYLAPQIKASNGLAEAVVSDNASTDDTLAVVEEAMKLGPVRYSRNATNIGGNPNTFRAVSELARGKFVLVLGDDDFLRPGAVQRIIEAIQTNPDIEYIHLNYVRYFVDSAPLKQPTDREFAKLDSFGRKDLESKRIGRIAELVADNPDGFTPSYCSVFRRDHAVGAYRVDGTIASWASIETVLPQVIYIAKYLLNKPAYYIGEPLVVTSSNISWKDFEPGYHLVYMPAVYNVLERGGAKRSDLDKHRDALCLHLAAQGTLVRMLADKETPMREQFSLWRFCFNFRRIRALRPLLLRTFVEHPRFSRSLAARMIRLTKQLRFLMRRTRERVGS